jgi:hypothetical protein
LYGGLPSIDYLKQRGLAEALDRLNKGRHVLCPAYAGGTDVIPRTNEAVKPSGERR